MIGCLKWLLYFHERDDSLTDHIILLFSEGYSVYQTTGISLTHSTETNQMTWFLNSSSHFSSLAMTHRQLSEAFTQPARMKLITLFKASHVSIWHGNALTVINQVSRIDWTIWSSSQFEICNLIARVNLTVFIGSVIHHSQS